MICPNCFREIPDRSAGCSKCGINFKSWAAGEGSDEAVTGGGKPKRRRSRLRRFLATVFGLALIGWLGWWGASPVLDRIAVGGTLVFVSSQDGNPELYALDPGRRAPVRLTHDPGADMSPTLSRDGRWVAFVSDRNGAESIYVMRVDGSGLTRLPLPEGRHSQPVWSPDGRALAFVSDADGVDGPAASEVLVATADGGHVVNVSRHESAQDGQPAWSPGGTRLAFVSNRDGEDRIYTVMADGTALAALTGRAASEDSPSWSPDGRRIAFVSEGDVFVMSVDGGAPRPLTGGASETPPASYALPSWSPDASRLAVFRSVQRASGRALELVVVREDGTGVEAAVAAEAGGVVWPDAERIVFLARPESGRSWVAIQRYSGPQVCVRRVRRAAQAWLRPLEATTAWAFALFSSAPAVDPSLTVLTESGAEAVDWAPGSSSD